MTRSGGASPVWIVAGLGNPGRRYARTRHNVGFRVVDRLAERLGVSLSQRRFEAVYGDCRFRDGRLLLLEPQTYMNESGRAVAHFVRYFRTDPSRLLVVCDDIALPFGRLRIRARGSSGGQKGLASVLRELGTQEVARLRVGVGAPPPEIDAADWVLSRFPDEQERALGEVIERAADCAELWAHEGVEAASRRYNAAPPAAEPGARARATE
ncbi:MAG: aminoacyl-tRNA hydrolase [Planctomycetota bacterium]|nr:MAG: aminoacyl-tRNA hydrolase [Planctomycetota bacterium]